jgi:hypothetical protein
MADFSLTTLFVVPTSQAALPTPGSSTQDLAAGIVGIFDNEYHATPTPSTAPYFYIAQGRTNTYLLGSKRSDKIKACSSGYPCNSNVTEWYKVCGCGSPTNQITQISGWTVKCGDILTITLRAHSSYIDTLFFNGLTRSVTIQAPCCECDGDPCADVTCSTMLDLIMSGLTGYAVTNGVIDWDTPNSEAPLDSNPSNINLNTFFTFSKVTVGEDTCVLQIEGKPLTAYGNPCDISAFPYEYDRMWFRSFVYAGPATTADFIVSDACNIIATSTVVQTSNYPKGSADEIKQLEKRYYSYQAGYLKSLYTKMGYNQNFETWVTDGAVYDTFYIKFNEFDRSGYNWGDYIPEDNMVIIAAETGHAASTAIELALENALGAVACDNICVTTTSTTTVAPTTTTTTTAPQG